MEKIDIINRIIRFVYINYITFFILIELTNYKSNNYVKSFVIIWTAFLESIVMVLLIKYIPDLIIIIVCYIIQGILISVLTTIRMIHSIIITFISLTITYLLYILSMTISGIIIQLINPSIEPNNIIYFLLGITIESITLYKIFKIKRLKMLQKRF